ncbi:MAG: tyrosine-protein phosphatase [Gemmatimonadaceae bacterium]|nr:tyrosine-protein phosphatase [Gemmatimonadaceae bacterium]
MTDQSRSPLNHYVLPDLPVVCSEHPGATVDTETARARWEVLAQYAPAVIVDLTDAGDQRPPYDPAVFGFRRAGSGGALWVPTRWSRPIPDGGTPPSVDAYAALIEELATRPDGLAIHCRAGIGRTGLVAAGLLVWHGWSADDAIAEVDRRWRDTPLGQAPVARFLRSPETESQREMVRAYAQRLEATRSPKSPSP